MKSLKGYRTVLFNSVGLLPDALNIIGQIVNIPEIQGIIPAQYHREYLLFLGVVNIFLRTKTTTPIGKRL